jgi:hypothetical protein
MKYLAPIPKQFVDQNGLPLSNGTVHVYISGDTQYANVYQDADGEELLPNPARLDSNGAWVGFVTAGIPLDYVVEDKDGNVQFEYEKVIAGSGTANVAIEPTITSGTKIAECWVDGELLELFAPEGGGGSQVQADWSENDAAAPSYIKNKPTIPAAQVQSNWGQTDSSKVDYIKNKPRIPAAQVNSDWAAVGNVEKILNKPMYFPNTSTHLSKVLTADDISNEYVDFEVGTSASIASPIQGVTTLLFARFYGFSLNSDDASAAFDTLDVGIQLTGGYVLPLIKVPHESIEDGSWKGFGIGGGFTFPVGSVKISIRLNLVPGSVNVGDKVQIRWNAMLVCDPGMF